MKANKITRKEGATLLIVASAPLLYYGFSNFEAGVSEPLKAIAISIGCTGGIACLLGGIYMFFTKAKGRGEDLLASQTSKGSPILDKAKIKRQNQKALKEFADKIRNETKKNYATSVANAQKEIINKKVNEMAKPKVTKDTSIADAVKEFREIGQTMKDGATRRSDLRAWLKERDMAIDEDGKIDAIEK